MSNQDYISRPPVKNKKNTRGSNAKKGTQRNQKSTQRANIPFKTKLITVIVLILLSVFAYGLWVLKTAPSTKTPLPNEKALHTETSKQTKTTTLPKPPKEKWSYVKDLENKKIEVGKYEVEEKGPYQMQCGSFKTPKQAQVLKANIAFAGISSQIRTVEGKNGTWHKVVLGPYERKRLAESDKHKLKRNNINTCQIWLWR